MAALDHTLWIQFKAGGDAVRAGIWESMSGVFRGNQTVSSGNVTSLRAGRRSAPEAPRNHREMRNNDGPRAPACWTISARAGDPGEQLPIQRFAASRPEGQASFDQF